MNSKMIISDLDFDVNSLKDDCIVFFDETMQANDIFMCLEKIFKYENDNKHESKIALSNLSFDTRVAMYKYILSNTQITNSSLLINVINLMKTYNSLSDDFFSNELIICNSLIEFLDVRTELKNDIESYQTELIKWYLSLFKSLHKIDLNFLDDAKEIPKSFQKILLAFDFYTLSGIFSKASAFSTDSLYLVKDAYNVLAVLVEKNFMSNNIINSFLNKAKENVK